MTLQVGSRSAAGKREENQDSLRHFESPFGSVFILADGMGGHQGGALAASIATSACEEQMCALPLSLTPERALEQVIRDVNRRVFQEGQDGDKSLRRMGSTIVALLVSQTDQRMFAIGAHVGDSRLYFARGGKMFRLTEDHTLIQPLIKNHTLSEKESQNHPNAGVLTRALGRAEEIAVDLTPWMMVEPGDRFLLCSDGLSGYVDDEAILSILLSEAGSAQVSRALLKLAFDKGSEDNVSVLVVTAEAETKSA